MKPGYWFFKLFNSVKEEHEVDFAELELVSLAGPVERVRNFVDTIERTPLRYFTRDPIRVQDVLTFEPCYGRFQGFMLQSQEVPNLERLIRRLAYTREIVAVLRDVEPKSFLASRLRRRRIERSVSFHKHGRYALFRLVTNQYYLEKSQYISKLSREEKEVKRNVRTLIDYPLRHFYRIPASSTLSVGKRLEDYFAIREEPSLYLTHMLHPYKGKFHPKMVRALLNYVMPTDDGVVLDNFAGSGTLLLEATLMGISSTGVEINPLSAIMSNVKCQSLAIRPDRLRGAVNLFLQEIAKRALTQEAHGAQGITSTEAELSTRAQPWEDLRVPVAVRRRFSPETVRQFEAARQIIHELAVEEDLRRLLLLGLSGTISDLARRTSKPFIQALSYRLKWMALRILLFVELNKYLGVRLGKSITYVGDSRYMSQCWTPEGELSSIEDESVDAIVNSPPYSTALDYIRNDYPQLTILGLIPSLEHLEQSMIGNPSMRHYSPSLLSEIGKKKPAFEQLPPRAKRVIHRLIRASRKADAVRLYKFFNDMHLSLREMHRVLKPDRKAVMIVGNNRYKLNGRYVEVENDSIVAEIAKIVGFVNERRPSPSKLLSGGNSTTGEVPGGTRRSVQKTMPGIIRAETVLVLQKAPRGDLVT